jgi:Fe(3+) dicitrate transport protein
MIPKYDVMDFSIAYKLKSIKLEAGINNLLNNYYFTRRATGYPGPGIKPPAPQNRYITLQFNF